jgi:hypothetical protein
MSNYYVINRMSGKVLAGPFARYVDAFNARAAIGAIGTVVER